MAKRGKRVSVLTRERARERMLSLPPEEKARRLEALRRGREAARSPERLVRVEAEIDKLGVEFKDHPEGHPRRLAIMAELRDLGRVRTSLKWRAE